MRGVCPVLSSDDCAGRGSTAVENGDSIYAAVQDIDEVERPSPALTCLQDNALADAGSFSSFNPTWFCPLVGQHAGFVDVGSGFLAMA